MPLPKMATLPSFFTFFLILLLHLGCFIFTSPKHPKTSIKLPKKTHTLKHKTTRALSSSWSFLKQILHKPDPKHAPSPNPDLPKPTNPPTSQPGPEISSEPDPLSLPLRNDIYPCPICGEVFQKPNLLELHKTTKHAVTVLSNGDSGKNIVEIIFNSGWPTKAQTPTIHRILKIHIGPNILTRFESHREAVKTKAAQNDVVLRRDERCIADGNELLRFYCATFICDLGQNGNSSVCKGRYCSLCGIIKSGFSHKMDGIATWATSWGAHVAVPEEMEEEFGFMNVRRAVLVCRVVAGRVGSEFGGKEGIGFDSVLGSGNDKMDGGDELLVFNPRAVLPCFVIVYTV